jgi:hypothetical protein
MIESEMGETKGDALWLQTGQARLGAFERIDMG